MNNNDIRMHVKVSVCLSVYSAGILWCMQTHTFVCVCAMWIHALLIDACDKMKGKSKCSSTTKHTSIYDGKTTDYIEHHTKLPYTKKIQLKKSTTQFTYLHYIFICISNSSTVMTLLVFFALMIRFIFMCAEIEKEREKSCKRLSTLNDKC